MIKKGTEIPTIDVVRVSIKAIGGTDEYVVDTASKIGVKPVTEEEKAVKLIVKGVLKAQKKATKTLTGTEITLKDNVFTPEIVKIMQGGTILTGTTDFGVGDAGLELYAKNVSKVTTLTVVNPGTNNAVLGVTVSGSDVTVSLETDGTGTATSTAAEVKAAIEANSSAADLLDVTLMGTGTGLVAVTAKTTITSEITGYEPPAIGSDPNAVPAFVLKAYSAQYNASGAIVRYECIEYPSCSADAVALETEDGAFRAPEYTINSTPDTGEKPYKISYLSALPAIA